MLDDTGYTEPENVNTRIWRPSLPVIRLASAIQVCCSSPNPRTGPPSLEGLLLRGDVIESVIRTAEYHRIGNCAEPVAVLRSNGIGGSSRPVLPPTARRCRSS